MWSEDGYCAQVSQIGHGRSYYLNEKADMCMVNNNDARYIYIRDDEDNTSWNIGEGPMNIEVDKYESTHHIGYTEIKSEKNKIQANWQLFVPYHGFNEVWTVTLNNSSDRERSLSLFSAVSFELEGFKYPRYYEMYRSCETRFDEEMNGVYCQSSHPFAPHKRYNGYIASSEEVYAFDGNLGKFLGTTSTLTKLDTSAVGLFQCPQTIKAGKDCSNSDAALFILGGVLQNKIKLLPNEEKTVHFVFGVSKSIEEARLVVKKQFTPGYIAKSLEKTIEHYFDKYSKMWVSTPNDKINALMNNWVKKQVEFCIVGKKGVRDNLQIAVALLGYMPERGKAEIIECLRHQFQDGHGVLTWYPYDDTRYSDQPFWIIWAVCELIKETGDVSLLNYNITYQDGGHGTMLEHVKVAVNRLIEDKGPNGLVKIWFADWNDALNITTDPEAESVMLSEQFCFALNELYELMLYIGNPQYADFLKCEYIKLKEAINNHAWDGDWYM